MSWCHSAEDFNKSKQQWHCLSKSMTGKMRRGRKEKEDDSHNLKPQALIYGNDLLMFSRLDVSMPPLSVLMLTCKALANILHHRSVPGNMQWKRIQLKNLVNSDRSSYLLESFTDPSVPVVQHIQPFDFPVP